MGNTLDIPLEPTTFFFFGILNGLRENFYRRTGKSVNPTENGNIEFRDLTGLKV